MTVAIAVANHKGGVGKTTSVFHVAAAYAAEGRRVLAVDLDRQASLTKLYGLDHNALALTIYDVLLGGSDAKTSTRHTNNRKIDILPANAQLANAEPRLQTREEPEGTLKRALAPVLECYDVVLFDCPPALDLLTTNALVAANKVYVPMTTENMALQALPDFIATTTEVRERFNPELEDQIFITIHQNRTGHGRAVLQAIREAFPGRVLASIIPHSVRVKDSLAASRPVFDYDPSSTVAEAYRNLAQEITHHA